MTFTISVINLKYDKNIYFHFELFVIGNNCK